MNQLTELLMYRALHFKQGGMSGSDAIIEHFVEKDGDVIDKLQLKNVCAKVSQQLADRLDNMCNVLDLSKRRFIESAIINALDEADRVCAEINMFEHFEQQEGK
jgi:predicted transcriptional regulator